MKVCISNSLLGNLDLLLSKFLSGLIRLTLALQLVAKLVVGVEVLVLTFSSCLHVLTLSFLSSVHSSFARNLLSCLSSLSEFTYMKQGNIICQSQLVTKCSVLKHAKSEQTSDGGTDNFAA